MSDMPAIPSPQNEEPSHDLHVSPSPTLAAVLYRRWGWPVAVDGAHLLLTTGPAMCAVELPDLVTRWVHRFLTLRLLAGPVVGLPGPRPRSALLAGSAEDAAPATLDLLDRGGAVVHRAGAVFPMPPSRLATGRVFWRVAPAPSTPWLPPFSAVVAALRHLPRPG
ncbi:hypothetical protein [Streptoalloteichus hindustanus]|uniref:Bifunctional DNA primase/polymerase, N-terminal n=1 Tax=Streptoalloteichus hindustanus TaxID=2017 RepID=A0A1M5LAY5_STRHI|nr:hypothetical protein [Streptoalloteichus hindustanus]SHG62140.1 hypothetical protein SAMN05444320_11147 [Streptoalloteichus hindustanus]